MKIVVNVKTHAKENALEMISASHYSVRLKALPVRGKANRALINLLASHFNIARSRITIVSGASMHKKFVEIL
jgi:uncharacterized protein YggU (UPF0235/DUF167 family)